MVYSVNLPPAAAAVLLQLELVFNHPVPAGCQCWSWSVGITGYGSMVSQDDFASFLSPYCLDGRCERFVLEPICSQQLKDIQDLRDPITFSKLVFA